MTDSADDELYRLAMALPLSRALATYGFPGHYVTVNEALAFARADPHREKAEQRVGQWMFNLLGVHRELGYLADAVRGTDDDPFYVDVPVGSERDDPRFRRFLRILGYHLTPSPPVGPPPL